MAAEAARPSLGTGLQGSLLAATFLVPLFVKLIDEHRIHITEEDFCLPVYAPPGSTTLEAPDHA